MESPSTPHSGLASQRIGKVSRVFLRKHSLWTLVKLARGYACMMGLSAPKDALGLRIWPRETRLPVSVLKAPWKTTDMVRIRGSSWSGGYLPNSPSPVSHIPKNVSITCKEGNSAYFLNARWMHQVENHPCSSFGAAQAAQLPTAQHMH